MRSSRAVLTLAALLVAGCSGSDRTITVTGPAGPTGPAGDRGLPGPTGAEGPAGLPGASVGATPLLAGEDPACPSGGTRFTTGTSVTYACNAVVEGACPAGLSSCGPSCVDLRNDPTNCGSCGNACDSRACVGGLCAKLVFITRQEFDGNLGGVAGADARCEASARAVGLSGTYRAWLSDSQGRSPAASFTRSQAPYVQPNGAVVAANWNGLVTTFLGTNFLIQPILLDEAGRFAQQNPWTGTTSTGFPATNFLLPNCSNWTTTDGDGFTGNVGSQSGSWTQGQRELCSLLRPLYCFEQ